MKLSFLIVFYVLSMVGSNVLFKFAAQASGLKALSWFIAANAAGFVAPVAITFALRMAPSNWVYALCLGFGFVILQTVAFFLFKESLSPWQWSGVAFIAIGIILLQIK